MAEEKDVTYTSVVFKTKKQTQPGAVKKEIIYDELKASHKNDNTLDINASAALLPDKKEEGRCRWYQQLAWCFGVLSVTLLLGVIAGCIYFALFPERGATELGRLKTNQTALLNENYNLTSLNNKLTSDLQNLRMNHTNLTIQFDALVEAFAVSESRLANLTEENQRLESKRRNLTEQIKDVETRWNEQSISRAQWTIDSYCPKNRNERTCKPCQGGWQTSQSSCYAINNPVSLSRKNWDKAREDCRGKTSDLVVVSDETEKRFVSENSWGSSGTQGYWIGLKAEDNKWKWVDGSELTNNDWIPQPANDNQCVISVESQGWKSVHCGEKQQWICEKRALSV